MVSLKWLTIALRVITAIIVISLTLLFTLHALDRLPSRILDVAGPSYITLANSLANSLNQAINPQNNTSLSHAYVFYATDRTYLCNALINTARLRKFKVHAKVAVLVPSSFGRAPEGRPLARIMDALRRLDVDFHAMDMDNHDLKRIDNTYSESLHKLELLKLKYDRIIYFDSDGLVMTSLDHLFTAPDADLLLPEAYYTPATPPGVDNQLSSAIMVIRPSEHLFLDAVKFAQNRTVMEFDMEIINNLARSEKYRMSTGILPWKRYLILSGIFRDPQSYLKGLAAPNETTDEMARWDARKVYDEAYYIHFSDWPIPKPWIDDKGVQIQQHGPTCRDPLLDPRKKADGDCDEVKIWRELYATFRHEMGTLCPGPGELD